jgi:hypothetical protein
LGSEKFLELFDRAVPPNQANPAIDNKRRRQQHIHLYYAANVSDVLDCGRDVQPTQGGFHVGLQLPALGTTGT